MNQLYEDKTKLESEYQKLEMDDVISPKLVLMKQGLKDTLNILNDLINFSEISSDRGFVEINWYKELRQLQYDSDVDFSKMFEDGIGLDISKIDLKRGNCTNDKEFLNKDSNMLGGEVKYSDNQLQTIESDSRDMEYNIYNPDEKSVHYKIDLFKKAISEQLKKILSYYKT